MNDRSEGRAGDTGENPARAMVSLPWCGIGFGLALFMFHVIVHRQYGFHGDELYFVVCGERPAWGYVDHPPFVPMIARVMTALFGVNLFALRVFPALALSVGCGLTGWLARRLGAGMFGEFLATLSFVCAPLLLRFGAILNIPSVEVLLWLIVAHLVVTVCSRDDARWWVGVGVVCGGALLNKHTTLFLGTGLAAGMLLTPRRRDLATPWPWIGGAAAFLIFLPNLLWQCRHDWATLEFVRSINASAMQGTPRIEFVVQQIILMNVVGAVVWIAGLVFFFMTPQGRSYRILGWVFVTVFAILMIFKAKVYYLAPAFPMLMAGGGVMLERWLAHRSLAVRAALPVAIAAMGLVFVPIMAPLGSLAWKEEYIARVLGFVVGDPRDLTFDFRYQLGRHEQLQDLQRVYEALDPEARANCFILTDEYDTASAVNVLGRAMGLPEAIGGNNSYYLWGPRDASGQCLIVLGYDEELLRRCFGDVRAAGETTSPWYSEHDGVRPIWLCSDPVAPLRETWPGFKLYR